MDNLGLSSISTRLPQTNDVTAQSAAQAAEGNGSPSLLTQALAATTQGDSGRASQLSAAPVVENDAMRLAAPAGFKQSGAQLAGQSASATRSIPIPTQAQPEPRGRDVFEQLRDDFRSERKQTLKTLQREFEV